MTEALGWTYFFQRRWFVVVELNAASLLQDILTSELIAALSMAMFAFASVAFCLLRPLSAWQFSSWLQAAVLSSALLQPFETLVCLGSASYISSGKLA